MSLAVVHRNEVTILGRLSAEPTERTLPSGDLVVSWRMVVHRPPDPRRATVAVDTIDCVARTAALGRRAKGWAAGDTMEMSGALRRRFWRSGEGVRSRYEVEVATARRVSRAAQGGGEQMSSA